MLQKSWGNIIFVSREHPFRNSTSHLCGTSHPFVIRYSPIAAILWLVRPPLAAILFWCPLPLLKLLKPLTGSMRLGTPLLEIFFPICQNWTFCKVILLNYKRKAALLWPSCLGIIWRETHPLTKVETKYVYCFSSYLMNFRSWGLLDHSLAIVTELLVIFELWL